MESSFLQEAKILLTIDQSFEEKEEEQKFLKTNFREIYKEMVFRARQLDPSYLEALFGEEKPNAVAEIMLIDFANFISEPDVSTYA